MTGGGDRAGVTGGDGGRRPRGGERAAETARRRHCRVAICFAFKSKGAEISFLEVDVANDAARRFYEGLHYRYLKILPGYYNGGSDAYGMIRELAAV